jgi:hypothetical protein
MLPGNGYILLNNPWMQIVPISSRVLEHVDIYVKSDHDIATTLKVDMFPCQDLWDLRRNERICSVTLTVGPKFEGWVPIPVGKTDLNQQFYRFEFFPGGHPISLRLVDGDGKSQIKPVGAYAAEDPNGSGSWDVREAYRKCLAMKFAPEQFPYSAGNVIHGVPRPEKWTNIWISDEGCAQHLDLTFDQIQTIRQIHITWDTNLERSYSRTPPLFRAPECVKDYEILGLTQADEWVLIVSVQGNFQRKRVHDFPTQAVKAVRIQIQSTNGAQEARIYEVRIYE